MKALQVYGQLDVLVNNAGYQYDAPFEQIAPEKFRDVIETCLFGVIHTTRAVVPIMRKQKRGHIFQVSSIGGRVSIPGNSPYVPRNGQLVDLAILWRTKSLLAGSKSAPWGQVEFVPTSKQEQAESCQSCYRIPSIGRPVTR